MILLAIELLTFVFDNNFKEKNVLMRGLSLIIELRLVQLFQFSLYKTLKKYAYKAISPEKHRSYLLIYTTYD